MRRPGAGGGREPEWADWPDHKLLDVRLCDLGVTIRGTELAERVTQLYDELAERKLRFRPHCWLSSEWFSADGVPGIAIPFYLAHPRLKKLEDRMMLDVEGGTKTRCMQFLRHEAGHAIECAYRLGRSRRWQRIFGRASRPYPDYYSPRPFSRNYVLHLDWWYAQSHPSEDFAETFAVWLVSGTNWRKRYHGWPALRKLEFVDALMQRIGRKAPPVRSRELVEPLSRLRQTLRDHYRDKQTRYQAEYPEFYDQQLRSLFPSPPAGNRYSTASSFLRRIAPDLRRRVARWTGEHPYTIDQVLKDMITRARELGLRVARPVSELRVEAAILVTMQTTNYLHSTDHRIAL